MKNKGMERWLLIAAVILGGLFFLDRVVFSGVRAKAQALRQEITTEEVNLRAGMGIQKRKDLIVRDRKQLAPYFLTLTDDRQILATFLKETERIAKDTGVTVIDFTPETVSDKPVETRMFRAKLRAEATNQEVLTFFSKIEQSQLLIRVEQFSLTPKDDQASTLRLETTISLAVP